MVSRELHVHINKKPKKTKKEKKQGVSETRTFRFFENNVRIVYEQFNGQITLRTCCFRNSGLQYKLDLYFFSQHLQAYSRLFIDNITEGD